MKAGIPPDLESEIGLVQAIFSSLFGLIIKDKAGNRSEYKESEKIRIKK